MEPNDLEEAVALAVRRVEAPYAADGPVTGQERLVAAAAIRVVLAEAKRSIEQALDPKRPWDDALVDVLAVLAGLVPPPPV